MAELDLIIRGGRIVNAGEVAVADVGIAAGAIAQIGGEMRAAREIDATGRLLLPGGIDAHVHLSSPPGRPAQEHQWVDDFTSGSRAALAGGITTLGNMTFLAAGETPLAGMEREAAVAREQTIADLFLHPVLGETTPACAGRNSPPARCRVQHDQVLHVHARLRRAGARLCRGDAAGGRERSADADPLRGRRADGGRRRATDRRRTDIAAPLRREPPGDLRGRGDAARRGDCRGDRRARLYRPSLIRSARWQSARMPRRAACRFMSRRAPSIST